MVSNRSKRELKATGQETADTLWQFLHDLGRDNVGVNFDPANMILYDKGDPIASMKKAGRFWANRSNSTFR